VNNLEKHSGQLTPKQIRAGFIGCYSTLSNRLMLQVNTPL